MAEHSDRQHLISDDTEQTEKQNGVPINVEIDVNTGEEKLTEVTVHVKPSLERWYILGAFVGLSFMQNCIWNTWGPISDSAKFVFGWTDTTLFMMSNWGPISFILSGAFFSWLLFKSLRWSIVLTAFVMCVGAGLRCLTSHQPAATWLIHIGQFFNGLGGPVLMGGCTVISAQWFPANQRATATGLATGLGVTGYATSFILGPYIVTDVDNATLSHCSNSSSPEYHDHNCSQTIRHIKSEIMLYMYGSFACCALLFVMVLIRYPSTPKVPPSLTASIQRSPFMASMKELFTHARFWMLAVPYALSGGVLGCWGSVLDINVSPFDVSQDTAGWMGFSGTMCGQLAVIIVGIFADVFARRMKMFLLSLFILGTVSFFIFALICSKVLPFNIVVLFAVNILGNMGVFGATPLFFELACESAYPVAEGVTNTLMTWLNNLAGLVFLSVLMLPVTGLAWMNWCLTACVAICIPVFVFYKERYKRLDLDTRTQCQNQGQEQEQNHIQGQGPDNLYGNPSPLNHDPTVTES